MKAFSKFVDAVLFNISDYIRNRHDPFLEQEKNGILDQIGESVDSSIENAAADALLLGAAYQMKNTRPILIQDDKLNLKLRSLSEKQRQIFSTV